MSSLLLLRRSCSVWAARRLPIATTTTTRYLSDNDKTFVDADGLLHKKTEVKDPVFAKDLNLERLLENNRRWRDAKRKKDPSYFERLATGQAPEFLYIGCSDSRVPANEIMGVGPGTVFVHRNVANLVVATDVNLMSCLQYAVEHLNVQHIIVTGHYDCGGVKAAMQRRELGVIDNWIRNIRDVYRLYKEELDAIPDEEGRHRRLVELNVIEQCLNLYKTGVVQKRRLETFHDPNIDHAYPRIHALVFDPAEGLLNRLKVDFRGEIESVRHIYDLYDSEEFKRVPFFKDECNPLEEA